VLKSISTMKNFKTLRTTVKTTTMTCTRQSTKRTLKPREQHLHLFQQQSQRKGTRCEKGDHLEISSRLHWQQRSSRNRQPTMKQ